MIDNWDELIQDAASIYGDTYSIYIDLSKKGLSAPQPKHLHPYILHTVFSLGITYRYPLPLMLRMRSVPSS